MPPPPPHPPPQKMHSHQASAITMSKINCILHVTLCYFTFFKASTKSLKLFSSSINNVQSGVNQKAGNSDLWFLVFCTLYNGDIHLIKFYENISNSFQVTIWTQIYYRNHNFQSSKGHYSISKITSYCVPHLF